MRAALFADGEVGLAICRFLVSQYRQDLAAVAVMKAGPIAELAQEAGIPVLAASDQQALLQVLPDALDLGILAWWPTIIKEPLINRPRLGFINTHPSLLPYNRGKHYNFWALVEQAPFGVTLHKVDAGVDSGDIVAQQAIDYDWTDTGGTLYHKAQAAMVSVFEQAWPTLREGDIPSIPQRGGAGSFHRAAELEPASRIDLDRQYRGRDLLNLLRARTFRPHPACWFEEDGQRYEITVEIRKAGR